MTVSVPWSTAMSELARPGNGHRAQGVSSDDAIAIVGMACRFPGARNLSDFWSLMERGGNAVSEGEPGSGDGRLGEMFPDNAARGAAGRFGAFVDDIDRFDAAFFRISPGGGAASRSAAAHDARDELARPRGCRHRSGPPEGHPDRRLHRNQHRRISHDGSRLRPAFGGGGMSLRPQRHEHEWRRGGGSPSCSG